MQSVQFTLPFPWVHGSDFATAVTYTGLLAILEVLLR